MTEKEAATKWCPMVRHTQEDSPSSNRYGVGNAVENWNCCIASNCMMWRVESISTDYDGNIVKTFGYCGLAGKDGI